MHEVRAKKHLGQHFLADANIARKIAASLPENTSHLLEIGPGTAMLSQFLLQRECEDFKMMEVDEESVSFLKTRYALSDDVLIHADFLKYPLEKLFDENYWIIGNFPYNISSQIFFKVLEHKNRVNGVVGMLQKEVAQRLVSPPGNKDYGILSVLLQAWYTTELLFTVPPGVFRPPPKVQSAVIRIIRNTTAQLACDEDLFKIVVKTAFNTRRKMLRNGLKSIGIPQEKLHCNIFDKRPEQLGVEEFISITQMISTP